MHHRLAHPRSGSIVHLRVGDTLELVLRQPPLQQGWRVTLRPYGVDLLEDSDEAADRRGRRPHLRRLMFRAMVGAGGILRLEEHRDRAGDVSVEPVDLLLTVSP